MAKKDTRSLDARAMEVFKKVGKELNARMGILEGEREARFVKAIMMLLKFKSIEEATKWFLRDNLRCDNLPPIDLVNSQYATNRLIKIIRRYKAKC